MFRLTNTLPVTYMYYTNTPVLSGVHVTRCLVVYPFVFFILATIDSIVVS
jgi:hypothetical protein